jgi:NitT/TauT family transport system ATP-binding protein
MTFLARKAGHAGERAIRSPEPTAAKLQTSPIRDTFITIRNLTKYFGQSAVYDDFSFDVPMGRFISIFGPNGCGKSTLINMISGLLPMDAGEVLYDGQTIANTQISYVFQNYRDALFPWLRAIDNIHYPLKIRGITKREREQRVARLLSEFDLKIDLNAYPYTMSGGQQQTVSILRALITQPQVMFLDEPFSALDYEMTLFMRDQLQRVFTETKTTTVLVSHDLEEAVYLSDYILLLSRHPARVVEFVPYDAPRPRTDRTMSEPGFIATKAHCLKLFQREVRRA